MEDMVERVARAMYAYTVRDCIAAERGFGVWKTDAEADAAAARLLEPGKYYDDQIANRIPLARTAIEAMGQAMIDAALTSSEAAPPQSL